MDGNFFRELFNRVAGQVDGQDLAARAVRAVGAGAKAVAERGLQEFSHDFIKGSVEGAYASLISDELAENISMNIRSFDEGKIKDLLDTVVEKMKEDETAAMMAKQMKEILKKADNDQIEGMIDHLIPADRFNERMIFKTFFMLQAGPALDEMRNMEEAEIAEKIQELADVIPTDILAQQVGAFTREITPERIVEQAHGVVGKLPSGAAVADIVHGVGNAAIKHFDAVARSRSLQDAANAFDALKTEAQEIVSGQISADNAAKETFDNKGQDKKSKGKDKGKGGKFNF